jgi:hypothetical protein
MDGYRYQLGIFLVFFSLIVCLLYRTYILFGHVSNITHSFYFQTLRVNLPLNLYSVKNSPCFGFGSAVSHIPESGFAFRIPVRISKIQEGGQPESTVEYKLAVP